MLLLNQRDEFKTVYKKTTYRARGYTPFQFSSRKTQMNTTQLGGLVPDNPISDLANELLSWHEMWINPEKVDLKRDFLLQGPKHSAGAIVTFHYRPNVIKMHVSGVVGWIRQGPQEEPPGIIQSLVTGEKLRDDTDAYGVKIMSNSPRVFLERLRSIAYEPMYFVGLDGVDHYNTKLIKIYTKQYPSGVICEGYYNNFNIPEGADDAETIHYEFDFTVESLKPLTFFQEMVGMFASETTSSVGKNIRTVPGLS